jgi:hypothetical protein
VDVIGLLILQCPQAIFDADGTLGMGLKISGVTLLLPDWPTARESLPCESAICSSISSSSLYTIPGSEKKN